MRLHPARDVHGISPEVVQEALATDDAGDHRAGIDTDAQLKAEVSDGLAGPHGVEHVERQQCECAGVISAGCRNSGGDHVAIADGLDLLEAVPLGEGVEVAEQVVEHPDHLGGRQVLSTRGEIDDVREEDRSLAELIGDGLRLRLQLVGDRPGEDVEQQILRPVLRAAEC